MSINIHKNIYQKLEYFYETNKIPHLLFHGASGSGKRTIVHHFLNKIYQGDHKKMKSNIMHVNCAHGKGIKFIREELKFFAKSNVQSNTGVLFKTIVLLNADNLTIDAQSALRRCIELFSSNTRFFIIVENKNKLLNPILSRFCEIYVPEYIENGKIINLHQLAIRSQFSLLEQEKRNDTYISEKMQDFIDVDENIHCLAVDLAANFYENGVSCIDILRWVESTDELAPETKSLTLLHFDEIKFEYRSEKLLMLCLFDFIMKNSTPVH
jgi:DNA polymerase III delta prime subunit